MEPPPKKPRHRSHCRREHADPPARGRGRKRIRTAHDGTRRKDRVLARRTIDPGQVRRAAERQRPRHLGSRASAQRGRRAREDRREGGNGPVHSAGPVGQGRARRPRAATRRVRHRGSRPPRPGSPRNSGERALAQPRREHRNGVLHAGAEDRAGRTSATERHRVGRSGDRQPGTAGGRDGGGRVLPRTGDPARREHGENHGRDRRRCTAHVERQLQGSGPPAEHRGSSEVSAGAAGPTWNGSWSTPRKGA